MDDVMLKVPMFLGFALMLSTVINFEADAGKYNILYFQGTIASPSCNFVLPIVSCYDPITHLFFTQKIQIDSQEKNIFSSNTLSVLSDVKQIKVILVKQLSVDEVLVSLNYN